MKKMSNTAVLKIALLLLLVFVLALAFSSKPPAPPGIFVQEQSVDFYENALFRYEINRYPSEANVSRILDRNLTVGVDTQTSNLNFGIVPTGGSYVTRFAALKNTKEKPVLIQLRAYGGIAPFVEFPQNDFTLDQNEDASVAIIFRTQEDTAVGNYRGEVDIITRQFKYIQLRIF